MIHLHLAVCISNDSVTEEYTSEMVRIVDKERAKSWLESGWNISCRIGPFVLFFIGISAFVSTSGSELPALRVIDMMMTFLLESEKQKYRPSLLQLIHSMLRKLLDM